MNEHKPPVLCIVGPTATGKSDLGIALAKILNGEVLSADSMQVYRGMDVGTAKVPLHARQGVPHHLLDLVEPDVRFTVADWVTAADEVIAALHRRGKLPIVVGGTGLYIRAICEDLDFGAATEAPEARQRWVRYLEAHGAEALHAALAKVDPPTAQRLHPNDTRRVLRALEVYEAGGGRPLSASYDWRVKGGRYWTVQFGLTVDRPILYERVNRRVDAMMADGLASEVTRLWERGYSRSLPAMQAIGYKELLAWLDGECSLAEAVAAVKQNTRRFVKRQLSWFRRDPRVEWIELDPEGRVEDADLQRILSVGQRMLAGIQSACRE